MPRDANPSVTFGPLVSATDMQGLGGKAKPRSVKQAKVGKTSKKIIGFRTKLKGDVEGG